MFIQSLVSWVKSLAVQFQKPQTYGSAIEAYIVSHNPQCVGDIENLQRRFDQHRNNSGWSL